MKHLKPWQVILSAATILLMAAGCSKNDNGPVPAVSAVSIIGASADAPGLIVYLDQNRVNGDSLHFSDHTGYVNAYSGSRQVTAYAGQIKKLSGTIALDQGKFYSLFLAGKFQSAEFVLLQDSLVNPGTGKANIRFVNMSVDAPSLDLGLADGSTLVSGRTYKQNSAYITVNGGQSYHFVIREHGATAVKVDMPAGTLNSGHSYTIWAKGLYTATGSNVLGGAVIENY
ncbi:DUF4397 domain-containing protein [Mucilaginibacter sp. dw_454]|uniref:DUF4397 domain-containing protein n=1 Tax=Mucilaginibacter sp. dw_454 TaxID=2720079 RepID=UPI001BD301DF|nr:DUF4397 domain-containing protein [Mucilaginibacter sp. dw_454]